MRYVVLTFLASIGCLGIGVWIAQSMSEGIRRDFVIGSLSLAHKKASAQKVGVLHKKKGRDGPFG